MEARSFSLSCSVSSGDNERVELSHGGGGRAMARLLETIIRPAFGEVHAQAAGSVSCRGVLGVPRAIDMLSGEQLPRIC